MSGQQQIPVVPVDIQVFSIEEVAEILKKQDPTQLPQWQFHGSPVVVNNMVRQVMMKVDRVKPPTIVVPDGGPMLVRG